MYRTRFAARIADPLCLLIVLLWNAAVAAAPTRVGDLCVVPVENGMPTDADLGVTWRMVSHVTMLPGNPLPLIFPVNRGGVWTVDRNRAFVRFEGPVPIGWLVEGSAISRGTERFDVAPGIARDATFHVLSSVYISRVDRTFLATTKGLMVVNGGKVEPVPGAEENAVGAVTSLFDLPNVRAMLLGKEGGRVLLRRDDGAAIPAYTYRFHPLGDWIQSIDELRAPDRAVIRAAEDTAVVEFSGTGDTLRIAAAYPLQAFEGNRGIDGSAEIVSAATGSYLVYGRTLKGRSRYAVGSAALAPLRGDDAVFNRLERLDGHSFVPVPGGDFLMSEPRSFNELSSRGLVLMKTSLKPGAFGNAGLVAYDGESVKPIPASSADYIGDYVRVLDAPSIGKVLLTSERGIFELTKQRTVKEIPLPFNMRSNPVTDVAELPASGVVILTTLKGVFVLDANGGVHTIRGGGQYEGSRLESAYGVIPIRNEMLLAGSNKLFLVVDQSLSGDSVCDRISP